jgi:antitoxin MazE
MKVKVAKWGNSLGVRLPKIAVEAVGATVGSDLDLTFGNGERDDR